MTDVPSKLYFGCLLILRIFTKKIQLSKGRPRFPPPPKKKKELNLSVHHAAKFLTYGMNFAYTLKIN